MMSEDPPPPQTTLYSQQRTLAVPHIDEMDHLPWNKTAKASSVVLMMIVMIDNDD